MKETTILIMHKGNLKNVYHILKELTGWSDMRCASCHIRPLPAGLTNTNFHISVEGEQYVLRLSCENSHVLNIDREREQRILERVSNSGIGIPLEAFERTSGHMLTRYVGGKTCTREEYNSGEIIERTARLLKRVHELPPVAGDFDPWNDIDRRICTLKAEDRTCLPDRIDFYRESIEEIRANRNSGPFSGKVFCHNDPFFSNFLYAADNVYLLDWEFGGSGDRFFDLVSATQVLGEEERDYFLSVYFDGDSWSRETAMMKMDQTRIVVMLWNGLWALLQERFSSIDHDFRKMAHMIFQRIDRTLENRADFEFQS